MKTIFDTSTRKEIIERIATLSSNDAPIWGKMTPYQMAKHCFLNDEMTHGIRPYKRLFIGRLFGSMALNQTLKDDHPIKRNQPTHPQMKISDHGDLDEQRDRWIALIEAYGQYDKLEILHPFFGKLNRDQIGKLVFKHTDHHLRQFGK